MRRNGQAGRVALTAVFTALALLFLYASVLLPTGRMGVVAVAGLLPAAAVVSGGLAAGALCYAGTSVLGLLLLADKGNALLFFLFFGLYPLVKAAVERIRKLPVEILIKLAFFNAVLTLFWFGLRAVFLAALPLPTEAAWVIYAAGNLVFLIYDFGFTKLIAFYAQRVDKVLRKGRT
ncbi:MAG: hypothetical protein EOM52_04630 [Clostridia bacterium]|nr:hypothetical protein [Clostridia bacterium]